jgi:GTP-binding protein Era
LFVLINKVDKGDQQKVEDAVAYWKDVLNPQVILPISAMHNFNIDVLLEQILTVIPEGPPYFEKDDEISDRNTRFFVAEMIRGSILQLYQKEIPYSVEVVIEDYKESEEIDRIKATIYCARESQKAILLGHQGKAIKKLGIESRMKIEDFVGKKIYLDLTVKVADDWRDNDKMLKRFGYE